MENCCKCEEYKEEQATQSSRITCLEYDNEDQLNRIIILEKDNQELKKDKQKLNNTINTLENTIITLNNKIIVLENKINNSEFEKIITKIITAIQDLNSKNNLEKLILKKSLFKLRKQRNNNNHYIDEDCNNYEIDCRNLYLLNKLKELSNEQIKLINNRICKQEDLIGEITLRDI